MANPQPNREGLVRRARLWRVRAEAVVQRALAQLQRRTTLPPQKAAATLAALVAPYGVSKRTLERHFAADIRALRERLRVRYRPLPVRHRERLMRLLHDVIDHPTATPSPAAMRAEPVGQSDTRRDVVSSPSLANGRKE